MRESLFGTVGRTRRGLTELYNVPVCVSFVSLYRVLAQLKRKGHANRRDHRISCQRAELIGGFLRGLAYRRGSPAHQQHIFQFVFSAAVPALLAVSASEGILRDTPENVRATRAVLDRVEAITIPSHAASPIIHIHLRSAATLSVSTTAFAKPRNPATPAPRDAPSFDIAGEERLLQDITDEELVETRPSIRLAIPPCGAVAQTWQDCERAAGVFKAAVMKVLTKRE
ncbi:hypothetical protein EDB92DRAFT_2116976 [Lactarius akahatsu]|uniref:Uncharacterized protein n=1 Tax=Lactarius akahatsu TaxID=416441 RepID=A0AAD4Q526_9AGAM|nr:hypothetical protein EDB92DRAFT_2116976 [Lactarius akahatsu]